MSKPLPGRAPANLPGSRGPAAATYPPHIHPGWQFAVSSGILGWILDAYYFFVLVFLVDVLAGKFHVSKAAIVWSITITLATRPLGALILGSMADKFGRRRPLIACVLFFSIVSAFTPFAPNYTAFLLLRALYGVGMGGYWGIGGILQAGYSLGYLLAAVAIPLVAPRCGWQWVFLGGLIIAALVAVLTVLSPESQAWKNSRPGSLLQMAHVLLRHKKDFAYLVLLMSAMTSLSHGTQDLYPDFLKTVHGFSGAVISNLAILYSVGAIVGSLVIGHFSEKLGRQRLREALALAGLPDTG